MVDTIGYGLSTNGSMGVNSYVYGTIETAGDTDLYRVYLDTGNYHINLGGDPLFGNALSDTLLRVYDGAGALLRLDDDNGAGSSSYIDFTAPTAGYYYVSATAWATGIGDYELSILDNIASAKLEPGMSVTERADTGWEGDFYSISLVGGVTYTFTLEPQAGGINSRSDPLDPLTEKTSLIVHNSDFSHVMRGDQTTPIILTYTPPASELYRIDVNAFNNWEHGYYSLSVTASVPPLNHRPAGTDATVTAVEDSSYTFSSSSFGYSDADGQSFAKLIVTSLPGAGLLYLGTSPVVVNQVIAASNLSNLRWYAPPNVNGNGVASFTFEVVDTGFHSGTDQTPNTITFNVMAVNDAPVITSNSSAVSAAVHVNENGTAVTTIQASDIDSTPTYAVSGTDAGLFDISAATGVLSFRVGPDFEAPRDAGGDNVYNITVLATDGALTDTQSLTITVHNVAGNTIFGTAGNNTVDASHAINSLAATSEEDTIDGKKGKDKLSGLAGNDTLVGGAGKDTLIGGAGNDRLNGGKDGDQFVFATKFRTAGVDTIVKFEHDTDKLVLENKVFKAIGSSLSDGEFYAKDGATAAHDESDHLVYNKTTGDLYYDKDGEGGAAAILFATISNHASLDHKDFLIV